jgi:hypothetical protein
MMDVIDSMGGCIYQPPILEAVAAKHYNKDVEHLTADERLETIRLADELARASLFIKNSNNKKYHQLKIKLSNDHVQGMTNSYPATMNAAYQMLTQFKAIVTNTAFTPSEGTSFAQTKKTTDHDLGFNKAKWEDRVCSLCGKKGHPPYPEWCTVAKAFNENPSLQSEFKETYLSTSDSDASKPSKRTTSRTASKDKDKQSKSKHSSKTPDSDTKKAIVHLMKAQEQQAKAQEKQAKQFAQLVKRLTPPSSENDSDNNYSSDEDNNLVFTMVEPTARNRRRSKNSRSAKNHRSAHSSSHSRKHATTRRAIPPPSDDDDHSDSSQSDASYSTTGTHSDPPDPGPSWVDVVKRRRHGHDQSNSFTF